MFQPFSYALMFLALVAVNHKWGKPYEEAKTQKELRRARRRARYEKDRAQDKKDFADAQEKRREARKKRRQEEERLEELYQNRRHAYETAGEGDESQEEFAKTAAIIERQKDKVKEANLPLGFRLRQPSWKWKAEEHSFLESRTDQGA